MTASIIHAGRLLGVTDMWDGTERLSGHSLRVSVAQGLVRLGWRPDAVQLMGRWESEAVKRYSRLAALEAPTGLPAAFMELCGVAREGVPLLNLPPFGHRTREEIGGIWVSHLPVF